jgi:demethylmenaquinone methyltransferase/2-methoxy-6-polyprenyl-1,4-benzoquinol methylase
MNQRKEHSRENITVMFDAISPTYDLTNRVMTFSLDKYWRKKVTSFLPDRPDLCVLDCATGTADQLISIMESGADVREAIGIDLSAPMLDLGRAKLAKKPYASRVRLQLANAMKLPFENESFDAVTISFGIRNVVDEPKTLGEFYRVLKPNGRLIVLEGSVPPNRVIRALHLFYLRHFMPRIGFMLSKDREAYRYLNETIETFPSGNAMTLLLSEGGFSGSCFKRLTFGLVTIYFGEKCS